MQRPAAHERHMFTNNAKAQHHRQGLTWYQPFLQLHLQPNPQPSLSTTEGHSTHLEPKVVVVKVPVVDNLAV